MRIEAKAQGAQSRSGYDMHQREVKRNPSSKTEGFIQRNGRWCVHGCRVTPAKWIMTVQRKEEFLIAFKQTSVVHPNTDIDTAQVDSHAHASATKWTGPLELFEGNYVLHDIRCDHCPCVTSHVVYLATILWAWVLCGCSVCVFFLFWVRRFCIFQPENFDFHTHGRIFTEKMTLMSHIFIKKLCITTTSSSR